MLLLAASEKLQLFAPLFVFRGLRQTGRQSLLDLVQAHLQNVEVLLMAFLMAFFQVALGALFQNVYESTPFNRLLRCPLGAS